MSEKIKVKISESNNFSGVITVRLPLEVRNVIRMLIQQRKEEETDLGKASKITMNRVCTRAILDEFNIEMIPVQEQEEEK